MRTCPELSSLEQFLQGTLGDQDSAIDQHVAACPKCQSRLESLLGSASDPGDRPASDQDPDWSPERARQIASRMRREPALLPPSSPRMAGTADRVTSEPEFDLAQPDSEPAALGSTVVRTTSATFVSPQRDSGSDERFPNHVLHEQIGRGGMGWSIGRLRLIWIAMSR